MITWRIGRSRLGICLFHNKYKFGKKQRLNGEGVVWLFVTPLIGFVWYPKDQ